MSGFELKRFVDLNKFESEELACGICFGIFCDPIETKCCRKTYCFDCINSCVESNGLCPNDRQILYSCDLIKCSKITLSLLSRLRIKCNYESIGCQEVVNLDSLSKHLKDCPFSICETCGLSLEPILTHNCVESLKKEMKVKKENQEMIVKQLENTIKLKDNEITILKERTFRFRAIITKLNEKLANGEKQTNERTESVDEFQSSKRQKHNLEEDKD